MMIAATCTSKRWGATMVETAFVLIPLTMFIFGIFEYGRLLINWNPLNNAAREGCRFALANNVDPNINTDVQNIVNTYMAERNTSFSNFTIAVSGSHSGTTTPVSNLSPGDPITGTGSGQNHF
jgi:Flp pilus assembly protein TadG